MPLSITKLEKLLSSQGFLPSKFFIMGGICVYIEVVSVSDANIFLLYIPSKYKFKMKHYPNSFKLKYVELDETPDNTTENYAGDPNEQDIEKTYNEIDIKSSYEGKDIESYMEEKYKKIISLKDISKEDTKEIKDIMRQLKRFKFCVQNVQYKIAIIYKNFLCAIRRDDELECFKIKKYQYTDYKKLYVTIHLELFYENMESIIMNMNDVKTGLYNILDKNQLNHTKILKVLMEDKKDIMEFSTKVYDKKQEYEKYIKEFETMLKTLVNSEKEHVKRIYAIDEQYNSDSGLHSDINKTHQISKINKELKRINGLKQNVVKNIFDLQEKRENTALMVDKIIFDNTVMLECILNNFKELGKLC